MGEIGLLTDPTQLDLVFLLKRFLMGKVEANS